MPDRTGLERGPDRKAVLKLLDNSPTRRECPRCGFEASNDDGAPLDFFRPWHLRGPNDLKAYVESLGEEAHEWLLALYVNGNFDLLAVDTIAVGGVSSCPISFGKIIYRGQQLGAEGFFLVHNHPSGDPTPSQTDIAVTVRLARMSHELDLPLLSHYVIAAGEMRTVGYW